MTPTRKRRLVAVILILAGVGLAATIASVSLQENLLYFLEKHSPVLRPWGT